MEWERTSFRVLGVMTPVGLLCEASSSRSAAKLSYDLFCREAIENAEKLVWDVRVRCTRSRQDAR